MRIFSGVMFVGACLAALATSMYPLYQQEGVTYMTYTDIWGTIYLILVAIALICMFFRKNGLMLGASLGALILAGLKYMFLKLEVDNSKFVMSHAAELERSASLLDKDPTVHHMSFVVGWNFWMFVGAAAAMLVFGFIYFCNAPSRNY
ncbi:MAG: hypothetical protein J5685_03805 [Clostridiales bacterium]|nr:hypothetical protein [Clostridiales bacterium]